MARFGHVSKRGGVSALILATSAGLLMSQLAHSTTSATAAVATTTTVTLPKPPTAVAGAPVHISATVKGVAPITGLLTFLDNGAPISKALKDAKGTGRYQIQPTTLAVGTHSITASFAGDAQNGASSSAPATMTITQAGTGGAGMSFSSTPATPVQGGTPISFAVTMTGTVGLPNPTGSVLFKSGTVSKSGQLNNGTASVAWPTSLPVGTDTVTASYSGDGSYAPQTQTLTITVTASPADKWLSHLYMDLIGGPDPGGQAYWASQMAKGVARPAVAYAFTQSPNYAIEVVKQLYLNIMLRPAAGDPLGANFWAVQLQKGMTPEKIAASMVASPERYSSASFGQGVDDTWIAATYQALLGRSDSGDPVGAAYWHNFLATGGPRWQMTLDFVSGPEWASVTVRNMYTKFHMNTQDTGGMSYWAGQVLAGLHDDRLAAALTSSDQYYQWTQNN
jgi:hypothetical protein